MSPRVRAACALCIPLPSAHATAKQNKKRLPHGRRHALIHRRSQSPSAAVVAAAVPAPRAAAQPAASAPAVAAPPAQARVQGCVQERRGPPRIQANGARR
ncbi:hypothetical protein COCVIDRAFT_88796 [Bipolaris victoriae FI3]|uniref:Uncharacterized protein n=1 Tax=Bipolaris victoriae (strain FI3) TaxID=930091 RepID=W7EKU4_BIPV3|nr:hypothetical protein COCVIDRAFT_88796 [Bipolaris victoriae FI3]